MKRLWSFIGTMVYWLTFPATWIILNNTERSRLVMFDDGKLLLVKNWLGSGRWGLPGGGLHKNEAARNSLLREVKEELGFDLNSRDIKLILTEPIRDHGIKTTLHYFAATRRQNLKFKLRKAEISEAAWLPVSEINSGNSSKDVLRAIAAYQKL